MSSVSAVDVRSCRSPRHVLAFPAIHSDGEVVYVSWAQPRRSCRRQSTPLRHASEDSQNRQRPLATSAPARVAGQQVLVNDANGDALAGDTLLWSVRSPSPGSCFLQDSRRLNPGLFHGSMGQTVSESKLASARRSAPSFLRLRRSARQIHACEVARIRRKRFQAPKPCRELEESSNLTGQLQPANDHRQNHTDRACSLVAHRAPSSWYVSRSLQDVYWDSSQPASCPFFDRHTLVMGYIRNRQASRDGPASCDALMVACFNTESAFSQAAAARWAHIPCVRRKPQLHPCLDIGLRCGTTVAFRLW